MQHDNVSRETLGKVIRAARKALPKEIRSVRRTAARVGIHYTYQSEIERDRKLPSDGVLSRIAKEVRAPYRTLKALRDAAAGEAA